LVLLYSFEYVHGSIDVFEDLHVVVFEHVTPHPVFLQRIHMSEDD
jgi:hypothetical protein